MVDLGNAEKIELCTCLIHTDIGPILLIDWYRPPGQDVTLINELECELDLYQDLAVGIILVTDANVHHRIWLRYSSGNTAEGEILHRILLCWWTHSCR